MYKLLFLGLILLIVVAIVVGVCAVILPPDQLIGLVRFRDFFDVTLPILAFGALLKYLCTCSRCTKCKD